MLPRTIRGFLLAALTAGSAASSSACYVEPVPPSVYADGYGPMFYDGYVVYYDDRGRPYYYPNGIATWVPVESPYYWPYVSHWHAYGPAYNRWYLHDGYRYYHYHYPSHYYGPYHSAPYHGHHH